MKRLGSRSWISRAVYIVRRDLLAGFYFLLLSVPAVAGDMPWNFLFTLSFLSEHRSEIIDAITRLIDYQPDALLNSLSYHRMLVMRPREFPVQLRLKPTAPEAFRPYGAIATQSQSMCPSPDTWSGIYGSSDSGIRLTDLSGYGGFSDNVGDMEIDDIFGEDVQVFGSPLPARRKNLVKYGQLSFFIEEEALDQEDEQLSSHSGTPGSAHALDLSPLPRSPARFTSTDTGLLYEHRQNNQYCRKNSQFTGEEMGRSEPSMSRQGWFIRNRVVPCDNLSLFNDSRFGEPYRKYANHCLRYPSQLEPSDRSADFAEVFIRVMDLSEEALQETKADQAYINDDLLCIVSSDYVREYEFCIKFRRYEPLSLYHLAQNRFIPANSLGETPGETV